MSSNVVHCAKVQQLLVTQKEAGVRLDIYLAEDARFRHYSRSFLQNLIKKDGIRVNGRSVRPDYKLRPADLIEITLPSPEESSLEPEPVRFDVIYEDEHLLVINKPAGLVVHPAAGHWRGTLVHGLLYYCSELSCINGEERPGIVHRLDRDTSGVMVVAKDDLAHHALVRQFAGRKVGKTYLALVDGVPRNKKGKIDMPIGRHPVHRKKMAVTPSSGREACTEWQVLECFGEKYSLLEVTPHTGRTHQIRVHLSHAGLPILGDPLYGKRGKASAVEVPRLCLHAKTLSFLHPVTAELVVFTAPLPDDMQMVIDQLRGYAKRAS